MFTKETMIFNRSLQKAKTSAPCVPIIVNSFFPSSGLQPRQGTGVRHIGGVGHVGLEGLGQEIHLSVHSCQLKRGEKFKPSKCSYLLGANCPDILKYLILKKSELQLFWRPPLLTKISPQLSTGHRVHRTRHTHC